MKTTTLKLTETETSHLLTALEFLLEEFGDEMDEDHPQYVMFQAVDKIYGRLAK
jgi:hypothetical protein